MSDGLQPAGFFALRTPLLPFDELLAWSDGLRAPAANTAPEIDSALRADRAVLTSRLLAAWARPEVREAVFVASPELDAALERSAQEKAQRGLVAYFARMAGRATPFGLFAGCSVGEVQRCTNLELGGRTT